MRKNGKNLDDIYDKLDELQRLLLMVFEQVQQEYSTDIEKEGYYTSAEVMALLNISENTLTKMRRKGKIQFLEISNYSYRYAKAQFQRLNKAA